MEVGVNKLLSFIKAGDKRKVSSAAHKTHICYATTQVYLGHLQRNLIINNEWACPCFRVGSFNLDHTFTGRAAVAQELIYQAQTIPYILQWCPEHTQTYPLWSFIYQCEKL